MPGKILKLHPQLQQKTIKQFNQQSTRSWARIILFYSEDESQALNTFFQLFENFLQRESSLDADTISRHQPPRKW